MKVTVTYTTVHTKELEVDDKYKNAFSYKEVPFSEYMKLGADLYFCACDIIGMDKNILGIQDNDTKEYLDLG